MSEMTVGKACGTRTAWIRLMAIVWVLGAAVAGIVVSAPPGAASTNRPAPSGVVTTTLQQARSLPLSSGFRRSGTPPRAANPKVSGPTCTFNGSSGPIITVFPGTSVAIACTGWQGLDSVTAFEISPLSLSTGSSNDVDLSHAQGYFSNGTGDVNGTFIVPSPFSATDAAAVCPPTSAQVDAGFLRCGILMSDGLAQPGGYIGIAAVAFDYVAAPPSTTAPSAVGIAATPNGGGYWVAWSNGRVSDHGNSGSFGDASTLKLVAPVSHIVATPDGLGYWLVASDGGTFAFGDAGFFGSMGGTPLNRPVVDLAPTPDGKGYWLVASDGGIFAFGDAGFHGSMGGQSLNRPVVGLAPDNATGGYWEVATDGGIFAFGAPFLGSTGSIHLNQPINGMTSTTDDGGYLFVASDGGIFAFGDAGFHGSAGSLVLNAPVVGMAVDSATGGYWLLGADGGIFAFDCPFHGAG